MTAHSSKILWLCLLVGTTNGYVSSPNPPFDKRGVFLRTSGKEKRIHWPSATEPVPIEKEIQLLQSGTLLRRGEFGPLYGSRALEVELECYEHGLTFHQATSLRKQLMVQKILKGSWKLKDDHTVNMIKTKFEKKQRPLLDISEEHDLPPVSIIRRAIVAPRVLQAYPQYTCIDARRPAGQIVQSIISEANKDNVDEFLSNWELKQLQTAKEHDVVSYQSNSTASEEWETKIYDFLDEQGINYIAEDTLKLLHGDKVRGTPDCLLVDDLYINGQKITWIEFKCFYASGLRENSYFTKKSLCKQITKYEEEFGKNGAVILKHGFSRKIKERYPSTMFLDGGPLYPENELRP